ncbi:SH3 domain-containing protein [uncultured Sphingomonas sp.]|uniref:SH3 domain-containing protein n=1 Tax=uncultured Sphingomonas sp. TaxID=158754 RepID=UPI0035CB522E
MAIDPLSNGVRRDLADIRLADIVFAPHYAAPMPCVVVLPTTLRAQAARGSAVLAELTAGEPFEVLEITRNTAWGVSPDRRLAGYVDSDALDHAS